MTSQAFRFGFGGEDVELDEDEILRDLDPIADVEPVDANTPHPLDLEDILCNVPSNIQYNIILVHGSNDDTVTLARRELFDIRAQVMAEDMDLNEVSTAGLSSNDIRPNVYEGGFKTWECSVDLTTYLLSHAQDSSQMILKPCDIIELGAGTALPTLLLFHRLLSSPITPRPPRRALILADYNPSVISLATIPNLLLTYALISQLIPSTSGNLEITPALLSSFKQALRDRNIHLRAVAGNWGSSLASVISSPDEPNRQYPAPNDALILASETIYSPASTLAFTTTLLELMREREERERSVRVLVAAKRVYFGVGGGVDDFLATLREHGEEGQEVWATEGMGSGVGRCIVELTRRA
ncbi:MAG: hypothetical protein LQ343_000024 [Gyalolechia ehrenbergii]|nr:MAG: hypothetical protein LQ343_000024 [Gyalolechia ehrenbergii]